MLDAGTRAPPSVGSASPQSSPMLECRMGRQLPAGFTLMVGLGQGCWHSAAQLRCCPYCAVAAHPSPVPRADEYPGLHGRRLWLIVPFIKGGEGRRAVLVALPGLAAENRAAVAMCCIGPRHEGRRGPQRSVPRVCCPPSMKGAAAPP